MWRREERLKYWLESGNQSQKPSSKSGLKEKFFLKFQPWQSVRAVRGESLRISAEAKELDNELDISAQIGNRLGNLGGMTTHSSDIAYDFENAERIVHDCNLLGSARIRNLDLPDERQARVRQERTDITSILGSVSINLLQAEIKMLESLYGQMPEVKGGCRFLLAYPLIQNQTSQISELPHTRASIQFDQLQDEERSSFLREGQILKGISCDKAELLAIFRHVPIELISRLRFLVDQRAILYSISHAHKPTQTRVHDMAAIRDGSSQEVHLVPHRAKYRSVSLN